MSACSALHLVVDTTHPAAEISVERLTSVTIDVCALKQNLSFVDPLLITLSGHLAPSILRVGGSDQNNFNFSSQPDRNFVTCYDKAGREAPLGCHQQCTFDSQYWASLHNFVDATGLQLLFGLSPADAENANSLIYHTAHRNYSGMFWLQLRQRADK